MSIKNLIRKLVPKKVKDFLAYQDGDEYSMKIYSQEGEDLLLKRIFENKPNGFYVDVGAHHPFRFSNTKLLYDRGWRGLNIEANPDVRGLFLKYRPDDMLVNMGVAAEEGELTYYQYQHPALNTFDSGLVQKRETKPIAESAIKTVPLSGILHTHLSPNQQIDLLSIDVEGLDMEVLQSNDWETFRPKWIIAEVILNEKSEDEMTLFLEQKGYVKMFSIYNSQFYKLDS